jgi:hypothetical protein
MKKKAIHKHILYSIGILFTVYLAYSICQFLPFENNYANSQDTISQDQLNRWVFEINKKHPPPFMVDEETKAFSISAGPGQFIWKYTMINATAKELKEINFIREVQSNLTRDVCNNSELAAYINRGLSIVYMYYGKDGNIAGSVTVNSSKCQKLQ